MKVLDITDRRPAARIGRLAECRAMACAKRQVTLFPSHWRKHAFARLDDALIRVDLLLQ